MILYGDSLERTASHLIPCIVNIEQHFGISLFWRYFWDHASTRISWTHGVPVCMCASVRGHIEGDGRGIASPERSQLSPGVSRCMECSGALCL